MIFFLDRDGTINIDYNFVHKREEWTFCDGAIEAIRLLNEHGYKVVVVTNQTGIVRRHFTLAQVEALHRWVDGELYRHGARIDAWYIAPWRPNMHEGRHPALLHDRKPETGMFERAMIRLHQYGDQSDGKTAPFHAGVLETVRLTDGGSPQIVPVVQGTDPVDLPHRQQVGAQIATMYADDFARSAMAGDKQSDLEPALKLGMKPCLIKSVHYESVNQSWIASNGIPVFERLIDAVKNELNVG
jgi:D,D-heptose 1,7-bisphosphate phosphatase